MNPTNKSFSIKARHKARALVLQALYQAQYNHTSKDEILLEYLLDNKDKKIDFDYFRELFTGVMDNALNIDEILTPALDRAVNELTPIELSVLRMSVYELKYRLDIPYRVVINEALELTKTFGTQDGFKYVNGVLDRLAKSLRTAEL